MTRAHAAVRTAIEADLPELVRLCGELRELGGRKTRTVGSDMETPLRAALADPARRLVVATIDDVPVGMALLSAAPLGPLAASISVQLDGLVVDGSARRRGIGRLLVAAAAAYAEEIGADQVAVAVYPALREASRFYARLGFAPVVVRRAAPVTLLRRRLAALEHRPALENLVRRRSLRGRSRLRAAAAVAAAAPVTPTEAP